MQLGNSCNHRNSWRSRADYVYDSSMSRFGRLGNSREFRLAVMSHGVHDSGDLEIRVSCDTESVSSRGAADRGRERSLLSAPAQRFNRGIFDINNVLRM